MITRFVPILLFGLVLAGDVKADAVSRQEQRREISRSSTLARSAARSAKQGKLDVAADEFEKAQLRMEALATGKVDSRLNKLFARAVGLLRQVHQQLGEAGVTLRPLELPEGAPEGGDPGPTA